MFVPSLYTLKFCSTGGGIFPFLRLKMAFGYMSLHPEILFVYVSLLRITYNILRILSRKSKLLYIQVGNFVYNKLKSTSIAHAGSLCFLGY